MTDRTEMRVQRICQRAKLIRRESEKRALSFSGITSVCLLVAIGGMLGIMHKPSEVCVEGAYSSVLLHSDVGAYIVIGLIAFVAGVTVTIVGIKYNKARRKVASAEREERL